MCLLGFHTFKFRDYWFPHKYADIITHHFLIAICKKCKIEELAGYFDLEKYEEEEFGEKVFSK